MTLCSSCFTSHDRSRPRRRSGSKSSPAARWCLLAAFLASSGSGGAPLIAAEIDAVRLATAKSAALAHAAQAREQLGLSAAEVADLGVSSIVPSRHNGLTHVYLMQRVNGLEVVNAILNIAVDRAGKAVYTASSV